MARETRAAAECEAGIFGLTEVRDFLSSVELGQTEMGPLAQECCKSKVFRAPVKIDRSKPFPGLSSEARYLRLSDGNL